MAYGEVQGKTWRSPSVRGLPDLGKLLWCYLLFNEHSNMLGYYLLPLAYMADDLEWSVDKVKRYLTDLEKHNLIAYDPVTEIVFVCKYLKYNRLSSGAREKGAIARLKNLSESLLLPRLLAAVNEWHPQLVELRSHLEEEMSSRSLFGIHKEFTRSPQGDIDIVIDKGIVVDKEQDKEETVTNQIIDYLNEKANTRFQHSLQSQKHIRARLQAGATVEDCCLIIDHKLKWLHDEEMAEYLRPATLFCPSHFEGYLAAAIRWDRNGRQRTKKEKLARNRAIADVGSELYDKQREAIGDGNGSG